MTISKSLEIAIVSSAKKAFRERWGFSPRSHVELVRMDAVSTSAFIVHVSKWDGGTDGNLVWDFFRVTIRDDKVIKTTVSEGFAVVNGDQ